MVENNQSIEAPELENPKPDVKKPEDADVEEFNDADDDNPRQLSELESSLTPTETVLKGSQPETLADFEVPVEDTLRWHESAELKDHIEVSQQEGSVSVTAQSAQAHIQNQIQLPVCPTSSSGLSKTSIPQFISSAPPTRRPQRSSTLAKRNSMCAGVVDQHNPSDPKTVSAVPILKTPSIDGYNWRKYGQKQVKSPQGSRSYYKCTYSKCYAKKIECCDRSMCIDIIYRGRHNHDPPRKLNFERESRLAPSVAPVLGSNITSHPIVTTNDTDPSTSSKDTLQWHESAEFKDHVEVSQQKGLGSVRAQSAQAHLQNQIQLPVCPTSSSEISKTSITQSISSACPTLRQQRSSTLAECNSACVEVVDQLNSSDPKTVSTVPILNAPSIDGYNWRKYGQKQVKSPQGFRSYYRCTYSKCYAKKIECCDRSKCVVDIICRGQHNHNPPQKINFTRESRPALSVAPVVASKITIHPLGTTNDADPSPSSKERIQEMPQIPETKRQNSTGSGGNAQINVEEYVDKPEPKQSSAYSGSLFNCGKKPKFDSQAIDNVGISGDGYSWRKYGQKMVKGNPHPRNYYRCTSTGCPVRKYIETATDNTSAAMITYKGTHDHDMSVNSVPKKQHDIPSAPLVAAAISMNRISRTQSLVNRKGKLTGAALALGGKKAMKSARTLLSIGFEIKPC